MNISKRHNNYECSNIEPKERISKLTGSITYIGTYGVPVKSRSWIFCADSATYHQPRKILKNLNSKTQTLKFPIFTTITTFLEAKNQNLNQRNHNLTCSSPTFSTESPTSVPSALTTAEVRYRALPNTLNRHELNSGDPPNPGETLREATMVCELDDNEALGGRGMKQLNT